MKIDQTNICGERRLIFQQILNQPEQQTQPPVETHNETVKIATEIAKDILPSSAENISNEYKNKGKSIIDNGHNKLNVFENLKVG